MARGVADARTVLRRVSLGLRMDVLAAELPVLDVRAAVAMLAGVLSAASLGGHVAFVTEARVRQLPSAVAVVSQGGLAVLAGTALTHLVLVALPADAVGVRPAAT